MYYHFSPRDRRVSIEENGLQLGQIPTLDYDEEDEHLHANQQLYFLSDIYDNSHMNYMKQVLDDIIGQTGNNPKEIDLWILNDPTNYFEIESRELDESHPLYETDQGFDIETYEYVSNDAIPTQYLSLYEFCDWNELGPEMTRVRDYYIDQYDLSCCDEDSDDEDEDDYEQYNNGTNNDVEMSEDY